MTGSQDQPEVLEPFKAPRFRLLIVGKTGVGKTSLINQAFGVALRVAHRYPGEHDVEKEITSSHNDKFILHDSEGVEYLPDGVNRRKVDDFIERRRQEPEVKDQLHAIWLCCALSVSNTFGPVEQRVLTAYCDRLPVVIVFTKFDLFIKQNRKCVKANHPNEDPDDLNTLVEKEIERRLQDDYLQPLRNCTENAKFPHAIVSVSAPHGASVQGLVKTTQQLLSQKFGPLASKSAALWVSVAQRVNPDDKVESSIEIALKEALELLDRATSLDNCLGSVHRNLIKIWNFENGDQHFSKESWLPRLRNGLRDANSKEIYGITPAQKKNNVANLMIYVTDLILILRMIFVQTRAVEGIRSLDDALIDAVFNAYTEQQRETVHKAVNEYLNDREDSVEFTPDDVAQHTRGLIRGSETRFDFVVNMPNLPPREITPSLPASLPDNRADGRTISSSGPDVSLPGRPGNERTPSPPERTVSPQTREDEHAPLPDDRLCAIAGDDADVFRGNVELKTKRAIPLMPLKSMTIKVFQTHQRFIKAGSKSLKWAACLRFRLDVQGSRFGSLKMRGILLNHPKEGVPEISGLFPPAPTGDHPDHTVRHDGSMALTVGIGGGPFPVPKVSLSGSKKVSHTETRQVVLTAFDNVSPRKEFAMEFTPLPGKSAVPGVLAFVVMVTYPRERGLFILELQFSSGESKDRCTIVCDGVEEIKKSVALIPWDPISHVKPTES